MNYICTIKCSQKNLKGVAGRFKQACEDMDLIGKKNKKIRLHLTCTKGLNPVLESTEKGLKSIFSLFLQWVLSFFAQAVC